MFKPHSINLFQTQGSVLAVTLIISAALAIMVVGITTLSRSSSRQAASLLSHARLRRMAQEKWTQSMIQLKRDGSLDKFDNSVSTNQWGVTQSTAQWVHQEDPLFRNTLYVVVSASSSQKKARPPTHLRLHTLLQFDVVDDPPDQAPPNLVQPIPVDDLREEVEKQLKNFIGEDNPIFDNLVGKVLDFLSKTNLSEGQTTEYRAPPDSYI
ncbi:hypothetical protein BVX98_03350, partial [bacterium F11]